MNHGYNKMDVIILLFSEMLIYSLVVCLPFKNSCKKIIKKKNLMLIV